MNENERKRGNRWYERPWRPHVIAGAVVGGVVLATLFALAFGWLVRLLWNWLMPELFGLGEITYWQAFGIVVLAKILFGAFGGGPPAAAAAAHHHHMKKQYQRHGPWEWDDEEWNVGGSYRNWKYFSRYWKEEGRAAFETFLERMNPNGAAT
jgi:hypothetical protein